MIIIIRSIMKTMGIFLGTLYFKVNMPCTAPLYSPGIMIMISNFAIFFVFQIFIFHFFFKSITNFCILKLIIFTAYYLKDSKNFFIQYSPLYISYLFSMFLNGDMVYIDKLDGICSSYF